MHLHIAIPAMDELAYLPRTLEAISQSEFGTSATIASVSSASAAYAASLATASTTLPYSVYVCVNQPEEWWDNPDHQEVCQHNATLLQFLEEYAAIPITILDYSSRGRGWRGKNYGVGWARKKLFEHILSVAAPNDLIVSMDADTLFCPQYLSSIITNFQQHPSWVALSVPYFHPLTHDEATNRALLRYEIYMRNYAINMLLIDSPYAFTALGSAIVVRVSALSKIGSITPAKSGEDFYLLQKLTKMGQVGSWNEQWVFPSARLSQRVVFGTGPAIVKGLAGEWDKYPIYAHSLFQQIAATYEKVDELYHHDIDTIFLRFLQQQFKQTDLWSSIRHNVKSSSQFRRAFHEKADGLRILQFLRQQQKIEGGSDLTILIENLNYYFTNTRCSREIISELQTTLQSLCAVNQWDDISTATLDRLRHNLLTIELSLRKRLI